MKRPHLIALALATTCFVAAQAPPATPPGVPGAKPVPRIDEEEMQRLYTSATAQFMKGNYNATLTVIRDIHAKTNRADHEAVMFLEGACHYNLKQYERAANIFELFISKFPKSESAAEARMAVGGCYLLLNNPDKGIALLKEAGQAEGTFEKACLMIGSWGKKAAKEAEALALLEQIIGGQIDIPGEGKPSVIRMMAEMYLARGETEKAQKVMKRLDISARGDETAVPCSRMARKMGDAMLEQKRYGEALLAYQLVRKQSELVRLQQQHVARLEEWVAVLSQPQGEVVFMDERLSRMDAVMMLKDEQAVLAEIEAAKDLDTHVYYRIGQCFYESRRYYEALLAFTKLYEGYRDFKDRDRCLFGMILCNATLGRTERAKALVVRFLSEFQDGANYGTISDMLR